jgi:hypothetical protein
MAFDRDSDVANIHLYAASLDDHSQFRADFHEFWNERVPWVTVTDDLLKHNG